MDLDDIGESGLIRRIREMAQSQHPDVRIAIGDDAAFTEGLPSLIATCDMLVQDVHFILSKNPPKLLGRKALAVNLSDIAAMAAKPRYALLGLGVPGSAPMQMLDDLLAGLFEMAALHGVSIIGGDTCSAQKLTISVTLLGQAGNGAPVTRSGAKPGDVIFVSGTLGDSALGLEILRALDGPLDLDGLSGHPEQELLTRHLDPVPRVGLGLNLCNRACSMIDLSDGLVTDLGHILEQSSGLAAKIRVNALPLSEAFKRFLSIEGLPRGRALSLAVGGGEDYELLFTAAADQAQAVFKAAQDAQVPVTAIGVMESSEQPGISFVDPDGKQLPKVAPVFSHFGVS